MGTKEKTIIKKNLVPFNYSSKKTITKREWVIAKDGKKILLTIIYNKWYANGKKTKSKRVYMTSYCAYGSGQGIGFSRSMPTWLNRGFIYLFVLFFSI